MTVQEITQKLNSQASAENSDRIQLFVIVYGKITEINLDSKDANLLITKWLV